MCAYLRTETQQSFILPVGCRKFWWFSVCSELAVSSMISVWWLMSAMWLDESGVGAEDWVGAADIILCSEATARWAAFTAADLNAFSLVDCSGSVIVCSFSLLWLLPGVCSRLLLLLEFVWLILKLLFAKSVLLTVVERVLLGDDGVFELKSLLSKFELFLKVLLVEDITN